MSLFAITDVVLYRFGRATIYMCGLAGMLVCLLLIGGLGFSTSQGSAMAVAILFLVSTLINMMTTGPVCYPIVAETPSGPLRYKTIVIGRTVYNLTGLVNNILTPRMVQAQAWGWGAKTGLFFAGTNMLCLTWCWFRLPETKDRSFGEIDILFENRIPARKFKSTKADRKFVQRRPADGQCLRITKSLNRSKRLKGTGPRWKSVTSKLLDTFPM